MSQHQLDGFAGGDGDVGDLGDLGSFNDLHSENIVHGDQKAAASSSSDDDSSGSSSGGSRMFSPTVPPIRVLTLCFRSQTVTAGAIPIPRRRCLQGTGVSSECVAFHIARCVECTSHMRTQKHVSTQHSMHRTFMSLHCSLEPSSRIALPMQTHGPPSGRPLQLTTRAPQPLPHLVAKQTSGLPHNLRLLKKIGGKMKPTNRSVGGTVGTYCSRVRLFSR